MTSANPRMRAYDEAADRRAFWAMVWRFIVIGALVALFFAVPLIGSLQ